MKSFRSEKFLIYLTLFSVLLFSLLESCSGVILTGMMLNAMLGTYLARGLLSSLMSQTAYTTIPNDDGTVTTIERTPNAADTLNTIKTVAQTLGMSRVIKEMLSEDENNEKKCKNGKCKRKGKKNKRKTKRSDSSSEEDDISTIAPVFHDNEDYSKYIIRGKYEDPEDLANEILADDDPMNFYYILKDNKKRIHKEKQALLGRNTSPENDGRPRDRFPPPERAPPPPPPHPSVFRSRFPLFLRFRKFPGLMSFF